MPSTIIIEPTNNCNIVCSICPNRFYKEKGNMSERLFTKIVEEINETVISVLLYFVGEPLIHPLLGNFIQLLKEKKIPSVTVSTNGTLLTPEKYTELSNSGLDELIICIDGLNSNTHSKTRKGSNLKQIEENLDLISCNPTFKSGNTKIIIQMIETKDNIHEKIDFIKKWKRKGFEPLVTWLDTWAGQFPELERQATNLCPNWNLPKQKCAELWFKMVINWKGNVLLCCHDWAETYVLGDVNKRKIFQIWNGVNNRGLRSLHVSNSFDKIFLCSHCREWSTLEEIIEYYLPFQNRKSWFTPSALIDLLHN